MTDDLMRAMTRLAERGTPVGVDEMVDRITAEVTPRGDTATWPSGRRARTTSWRRAVGVAVVALAVVLAVALVWLPHGDGGGNDRVSTTTLTPERLTAGPAAVLAAPGQGPSLLVRTAGALWAAGGVSDRAANTLYELDPSSGAVRARVTVPGRVVAITPGFGSLWLAIAAPPAGTGNADGGAVLRVDPRTGRTLATIPVGDPTQLAVGAGAVWVTEQTTGVLAKIDPVANSLAASGPVGGASAVTIVAGHVWVASPGQDRITVLDARTVAPLLVFQPSTRTDVLVGSGEDLWATSAGGSVLTHYDGMSRISLGSVRLGGRLLTAVPAPNGAVWVGVDRGGRTVVGLVRPGRGGFVASRPLTGSSASALVPTSRGLWILDGASSMLSLLEAR